MFNCTSCSKSFSRKDNLLRHMRTACSKSRFFNQRVAKSTVNEKKERFCKDCNVPVLSNMWVGHLLSNFHKNNSKMIEDKGVQIIKSAFKERIVSYRITTEKNILDVKQYFQHLESKIQCILDYQLNKHTCIKINMELFGYYYNPTSENYDVKSFNTPFNVICKGTETKDLMEKLIIIIDKKADEFAERDSGKLYS
ncbi:uncharacterized protein LOC115888595 [Sitophilus oryzae]|uniref:Uncharacterized protein LOC115888595 n=1 Tax=Sitophilus oryzae TaxID=7048 RepID=A0A6J2YM23_SITOR|nr:uncharacterized protein LOC115888595 [Sitophilus oryzae]